MSSMPQTRTQDDIQVQRSIQSNSRATEPATRVSVQEVAESLYIHPFMLSRWRKEAREGRIVTKGVQVDKDVAAELKQLRKVKRDYERLKIEHELLKKAIEFTSKRKQTSSPSSSTAKRSTRSG